MSPGVMTRGQLTRNFLQGDLSPQDYLELLKPNLQSYSELNLLLGDSSKLWFCSNRQINIQKVEAGIYGINNGYFDEN